MANKNLIAQLQKAKTDGYADGFLDGMLAGMDVAAIAVNHTHHFGDKRLSVVEAECQRILDEIQDAKDIEMVLCNIYKELCRIRPGKESKEFFLKRYIKL